MNKVNVTNKTNQTNNQFTQYDASIIKYTPLSRLDFDTNVINNWAEIRISKPPKRRTNQISFTYNNFFYIYGGRDINEGKMSDMYKLSLDNNWENKQWEKVEFSGASPGNIAHHRSSVIDNILYVFGGDSQKENITNNLFLFNIDNLTWEKQINKDKDIIPLSSHSMSLYLNNLIIFGGYSSTAFNDKLFIYKTETKTWSQYPDSNIQLTETQNIPEGRIDHSQTTVGNAIYIYGGLNQKNVYLNEMWKFDLGNITWNQVNIQGEIPKGRKGHSAVLFEGNILFFGGKTGQLFEINQLWKYDIIKERFQLLHDTMLERSFEDEANTTGSSMYTTQHNQTNPPGTKLFDKNMNMISRSKRNGMNEISKMSKTSNATGFRFLQIKKKHLEQFALSSPKAKIMKGSLIFKIEEEDHAFIKQLASINKIQLSADKIRYKILPLPRDGHSAVINENKMYIFGGDRNKYPFNDFFMFQLK